MLQVCFTNNNNPLGDIMNSFRYALLSISLLALNAVAMEEETVVIVTTDVLGQVGEILVAEKAGEVVAEVAEVVVEPVISASVEAAVVAEPAKSIFAKTSDVFKNGYSRSAEFVSGTAEQTNAFLGKSVDFVVVKTGYGAELVAAHPVAAKATLVAGTTAAVAGVTYGTYKLYRHFVPAQAA
jgi:hypothetical protein